MGYMGTRNGYQKWVPEMGTRNGYQKWVPERDLLLRICCLGFVASSNSICIVSNYLIGMPQNGNPIGTIGTPKLQNSVSFRSRLALPKLQSTGRTLLACNAPQCTIYNLEGSSSLFCNKLSHKFKNVDNAWVFTVWHKCTTHGFSQFGTNVQRMGFHSLAQMYNA